MNEEKMQAIKDVIREANEPDTIKIPAGGIGEISDGYHTFNELEATVPLMLSDDYRARFIAEYRQTKIRGDRLERFCNRIRAAEITGKEPPKHDCPLWILEEQLGHMTGYLRDLKLRAEIEGIDLT